MSYTRHHLEIMRFTDGVMEEQSESVEISLINKCRLLKDEYEQLKYGSKQTNDVIDMLEIVGEKLVKAEDELRSYMFKYKFKSSVETDLDM